MQTLKGGWLAIVMEFINGHKISITNRADQQKCKDFLKQTVLSKLKKRNYVHGDLRLTNIMKYNGQFLVLDYDWAGVDGCARFPLDLNTMLRWPESVVPGGHITALINEQIVNSSEALL